MPKNYVAEILPHQDRVILDGHYYTTARIRAALNDNKLLDLIQHMQVHAGYTKCGYFQMSTEQKNLFDEILNEEYT